METQSYPTLRTDPRPEAMADVPGVCELPLTRAVVQYRDLHEIDYPGGRIQDIGLALVLEGRYASSAQVVDLGSSEVKYLDLSSELVVLDWVYDPTLDYVRSLAASTVLDGPASEGARELGPYCFGLGLRVLNRVGFGPLTRPTLLRIGFRDVCRDLDLHDGTSVRVVLGPGRLTRAHLDYDANALVFRTAWTHADQVLEEALAEAFPTRLIEKLVPALEGGPLAYQVRFPLPVSLAEVLQTVHRVRRGLGHLLARFEPQRYEAVDRLLNTFGERDTLNQLSFREPRVQPVPLHGRALGGGPRVH